MSPTRGAWRAGSYVAGSDRVGEVLMSCRLNRYFVYNETDVVRSVKGILYGGVYLSKFPIFFKKSFSMRGAYLIFGGSQIYPPGQISKIWPYFRNLTPMYIWGVHCAFLHFSCQATRYPPYYHTPSYR